MTQNNTTVATVNNKTTKIDKTPTNTVKTLKDKEAIRKKREEEYANFRVNSLKRRAKRMGLTEEQTNVKIAELKNQLSTPNSYNVLLMYNKENAAMVKQALNNESVTCKIITDSYAWLDADQEMLGTLREILPSLAKIVPYVKKKPPVLPPSPKAKDGYVTKGTDKSNTAKGRRNMKKAERIATKIKNAKAHNDQKLHSELQKAKKINSRRKLAKHLKALHKKCLKAAQKAPNKSGGTTVRQANKKPATSPKMAPKTVKNAA